MKKIIILLSIFFLWTIIYANPRPPVDLLITELYFDENDKWYLELSFISMGDVDEEYNSFYTFPNFYLHSLTDTIYLFQKEFYVDNGVMVITQDSLNEHLHINKTGDRIGFFMEYNSSNELKFGNIDGAIIGSPEINQSISLYKGIYFVKDNSPSIGSPNSNQIWGTLQGCVYDMDTLPIPNRKFWLRGEEYNYEFTTNENGEYAVQTLSKPHQICSIYYVPTYGLNILTTDSIAFSMEPDSFITRDIFILDSLSPDHISHYNSEKDPVKLYPNPIARNENLLYEIDLPILTANALIEIISIDGKIINRKKITNRTGEIKLPAKAAVYIVNIKIDKQLIDRKSVV